MKFLTLFTLSALFTIQTGQTAQATLLIEDFQTALQIKSNSAGMVLPIRLYGGFSEMKTGLETDKGLFYLRMRGTVTTANNGGFIQVRKFLNADRSPFDASQYTGLAVTVKGTPGSYYLHLRTPENWFPWSFYESAIAVSTEWTRLEIPFTDFNGVSSGTRLNIKKLLSVALFAGTKDFQADISMARIEFY